MKPADSQPEGGLPQEYLDVLDQTRARQTQSFRLRWKGTNIPRGASVVIDKVLYMIAMTQNGIVVSGDGTELGYYTREPESDGMQSMIIATEGEVQAGAGQLVEMLRDFSLQVGSALS